MAEFDKSESKGLPLTVVFALEELNKKLTSILEAVERIEEKLTEL